jgi:hypothetical protein
VPRGYPRLRTRTTANLGTAWSAFWRGLWATLLEWMDRIRNWFRDLPGNVRRWIGDLSQTLVPSGRQLIGGFLDSGGVGLWGILAPLGALVFSDVGSAARWYD